MSKVLGVLLLVGAALCIGLPISRAAKPDLREETISGRSFRAIQAALPVLESNGLKVDDYAITVSQLGSHLVVPFSQSEKKILRPSPGRVRRATT